MSNKSKITCKQILYRCTAAVLCMLLLLPVSAFAAEGTNDGTVPVTYDESVYVTLDHYGNQKQLSVVKGVDLNGNKTFTDYGSYSKVNNMSGYEQPQVTAEGAQWDLKDYNKSRLYFECTPQDTTSMVMPWTFKVSYKLNGVPTKAEDLAGKSGTVEIIAECQANDNINDYMKNNMLLQLVTLVDTEKVLSIEAEGSQTQALGKYKAVIFAALPGESRTFNIRIGTDSFSSLGLILMMEPATLAQMDQLKQLREAKETIGDAPAVLLSGLNSMLQSVSSMADGMEQTGQGIDSFKKAYATAQDYSGDVISSSQDMIEGFSGLSHEISGFIPYIKTISDQITSLKDLLASLSAQLPAAPEQMTGQQIQTYLDAAGPKVEEAQQMAAKLAAENETFQKAVGSIQEKATGNESLTGQASSLNVLAQSLNEQVKPLAEAPGTLAQQQLDLQKLLEMLGDLAQIVQDPQVIAGAKALAETFAAAMQQAGQAGLQMFLIAQGAASLMGALTDAVSGSASDLNVGVKKVLDGLSGITSSAPGLSDASNKMQGVSGTLQSALDKVLNKFTEGNNLLNIDPSLQKRSMTSEKNGAPSSLQVVLRTETIGVELMKEGDEAKNQTAQTPWARIKLVFEKIWKAVQTLFE